MRDPDVNGCYLDDDGSLSADIIVAEEENTEGHRQSLWVSVRPVYYGNQPSKEPMVQVCYQEEHMRGPLSGPVWVTPEVWGQLVRAVRWRLRRRRWQNMKRKLWRRHERDHGDYSP